MSIAGGHCAGQICVPLEFIGALALAAGKLPALPNPVVQGTEHGRGELEGEGEGPGSTSSRSAALAQHGQVQHFPRREDYLDHDHDGYVRRIATSSFSAAFCLIDCHTFMICVYRMQLKTSISYSSTRGPNLSRWAPTEACTSSSQPAGKRNSKKRKPPDVATAVDGTLHEWRLNFSGVDFRQTSNPSCVNVETNSFSL